MATRVERWRRAERVRRQAQGISLTLVLLASLGVVLHSEIGSRWLAARLQPPAPASISSPRPSAIAAAAVDWSGVGQVGEQYLQTCLRYDTSQATARTQVAQWLYETLSQANVEAQLLDCGNGRLAVLARLPGSGEARPLVLYSPLATGAPARELWTVDPLAGLENGGYIYGVGALEPKGQMIAHLLTMLVLKRLDMPLQRDVLFLAVDDAALLEDPQNAATIALGALKPEFLIGAGGGGCQEIQAGSPAWLVGTFSQGSMLVRLGVARSETEAGANLPSDAGERLQRGVNALLAWRSAIVPSATTSEFFHRLVARYPAGIRTLLAMPWTWSRFIAPRLEQSPSAAAHLRDWVSLVRLEPWPDDPLCPSAVLEVHTMPGRPSAQVLQELRTQLAGYGLRLQVLSEVGACEASWANELAAAIEQVAGTQRDGLTVLPTGGAPQVGRRLALTGVACYGILPFDLPAGELERVGQGDERLATANLALGSRRMVQVVLELCGR